MKKIIFMLINMNVGGVEKALLNMVNEIPMEKYKITIFMLEKYGGFLAHIPSHIQIEYFDDYWRFKDYINKPPKVLVYSLIKQGQIINAIIISFLHILTKIRKNRSLYFKYLLRKYSPLQEEYDVAIAYDGPMDFISYFVLEKIRAKKKIQWIHFDVTHVGFNIKFAAKIYHRFDKVFVVSEEAKNKLLHKVPVLSGKTEIFSNIVSQRNIEKRSKEGTGFTDSFRGIRILTVGRLSMEKGQDLAIHALKKLVDEGYDAKWYCVGEGNARQTYETLIDKLDLRDRFILLGMDPNPYPYMDQCDIYVQPSRHEGFCITLAEAKCLKKTIVTTSFAGAREQIQDGTTGLVVDVSVNAIYGALIQLINNPELRNEFSKSLELDSFESKGKIEKFLLSAI